MKVYVLLKSDFKGNFKLVKIFGQRETAKKFKDLCSEEERRALIIQEWQVVKE